MHRGRLCKSVSLNGSAITGDAGSAAAMSMARSSLMTALLGSTQNGVLSGNWPSAGHRRPLIQEQLVDHQGPNQQHHERQCDRDGALSGPPPRDHDLENLAVGPHYKRNWTCQRHILTRGRQLP